MQPVRCVDIDNLLLHMKIKIFSEIRQQTFGILSHFYSYWWSLVSVSWICMLKLVLNILEYFVHGWLAKLKHKNNYFCLPCLKMLFAELEFHFRMSKLIAYMKLLSLSQRCEKWFNYFYSYQWLFLNSLWNTGQINLHWDIILCWCFSWKL